MIINKLKDAHTGHSLLNDELTITRGKFYEYLGMAISFEKEGEIQTTIYDYVSTLID